MRQTISVGAIVVCLLIASLLLSSEVSAQRVSLRASAGIVHLPLSDWSGFFGKQIDSYYQKNNPNAYYAFSFHYALSEHHSVSIGAELIRTSASLSSTLGSVPFVVKWQFQGIPLSLCYEYRFTPFNELFIPVAGAGISYVVSEVEATESFFNQTRKRTGNGFGVHGSVGLISQLTRSLGMLTQIRYRYSNGMAFTDSAGDIKVEFTGFDISTGLTWTF